AEIGLVDRIFTRVGASDNLVGGESTFMVEMRETANILAGLTPRSLVVLDEIGRGTSTFDGISIAWAVAEHLHDALERPRTLFATHYHELTALGAEKPRVRNLSVAVADQCSMGSAGSTGLAPAFAFGSSNQKREPAPGFELTPASPPCASASRRTVARPRPRPATPWFPPRTYGSKIPPRSSGATPGPVSS